MGILGKLYYYIIKICFIENFVIIDDVLFELIITMVKIALLILLFKEGYLYKISLKSDK